MSANQNTNILILGKAEKAAKAIRAAAKSSNPSDYFGRSFDDLFENGDGREVFIHLARMCRDDESLMEDARTVNYWTNVDYMMDTLKEYEERHPTLF